MSADDFALLVGISKYPNPGYSNLDGPSKDVALMKKWLTDPAGGAVPDDVNHIVTIETPEPYPLQFDPDKAPPVADQFDAEFLKLLRARMALKEQRVKGRLYLYFSGHGFCSRDTTRDSEAALYSANATKEFYEHIYGTQYARVAKGQALFQEIVLIMDCCRDSEINRRPTPRPYSDRPDDGLAAEARLLAIYAVPKGGKAQERQISERGNEVHGLLTHAFIKALDEARPSEEKGISSTALRGHIFATWQTVCAPEPPPRPEILLPSNGDIIFGARNAGEEVVIGFQNNHPRDTVLMLWNSKLKKIAEFGVSDADSDLFAQNGPVISVARKDTTLILRLQPGYYEFALSSPGGASGTITVGGSGANITV
jgi:Caspase domain